MMDQGTIETGSTRIWHQNLSLWLRQLGAEVHQNSSESTTQYDIIICAKNTSLNSLKNLKQKHPKSKIGLVNPSDYTYEARLKLKLADFFIVGSIEEKVYYHQFSDHIFIIPLIETIFTTHKNHEKKDQIVLGYHGNKHHLHQFSPHLTKAIEKLSKHHDIKLKVIFDIKNLGKWKFGRPKNILIEEIQWDKNNIEDELLECDIGLVPGCSEMSSLQKTFCLLLDKLQPRSGFNTDFFARFKNTANHGRSFVFHQLKIPIVADFVPSQFHILGDDQSGFLAQNEASWYYGLKKLCESHELRQSMANLALKHFEEKYNPIAWSSLMLEKLKTSV